MVLDEKHASNAHDPQHDLQAYFSLSQGSSLDKVNAERVYEDIQRRAKNVFGKLTEIYVSNVDYGKGRAGLQGSDTS